MLKGQGTEPFEYFSMLVLYISELPNKSLTVNTKIKVSHHLAPINDLICL
jgi:hypothetical protein